MDINEMQQKRVLPQSELDFYLMTTDSVWGKQEVPPELKDKLNKYFIQKNERGEEYIVPRSDWGLMGFFTRDFRLGNLSEWNGELNYCQYHSELANDFIHSGFSEPFLITLSRVAVRLELSQSKGGMLRRLMNTFRMENINREEEPPKKKLFGMSKNQDGGM